MSILDRILRILFGSYTVKCIGLPHRAATFVLRCCPFAYAMKRCEDGVTFSIPAHCRKRTAKAAEEYRLTVEFDGGHGLANLLHRYRNRPGIAVGTALFFAVVFMSGNVVWNITLEDSRGASRETILQRLYEMGLREGAYIPSLDLDSMCGRYILEYDDLSWISVNMFGSTAMVEVRRELSRPAPESTAPSNLISTSDGQIAYFNVTQGTPVTEVGETVLKGQPLVTGIVEYKDGTVRTVRSKGEVYAYTRRIIETTVPYTYQRRIPTGNTESRRTLEFFGISIKLYINEMKSNENYDRMVQEKVFSLPDGKKLPVSLITETYTEYREEQAALTEEEAKKQAERQIEQAISETAQTCEVLTRTVTGEATAEGYKIKAELYCLENIAYETELIK